MQESGQSLAKGRKHTLRSGLIVHNPWLRRDELGGGLLFKGSVCYLKNLGRW